MPTMTEELDSLYLRICARMFMYTYTYTRGFKNRWEDCHFLWVSSPDSPAAFLASLRREALDQ